ncbi:MAG: trypsin-like peptidase domain-containing protein [Pseudomonadota bacterium]|nr:trypsin-like peptidase domain-containing protein [Pseudomonadota bacterium]
MSWHQIKAGSLRATLGWVLAAVFGAVLGLGLRDALPEARAVPLNLQEAPAGAQRSQSMAPAARRAQPSVVNIYTSKELRMPRNPLFDDPVFRHFFGVPGGAESQVQNSLGSGVIADADGHILTNNHVVEAADQIEVALNDGRRMVAKVVGTDPETDLAVLKIDAHNLNPITWGHADTLQIGDFVLAIGNPFGVGQTVTMGIVSALGRSNLGINVLESFIQTDAAINPGNSGGALVDANGYLIGINSAIYSKGGGSLGIGFAIPESIVRQVMEQIIQHGSVARGWLGIEPQDIPNDAATALGLKGGAFVAALLRGSPGDRAGVRPGDILLALNGVPIQSAGNALAQFANTHPGQTIHLRLLRNQKEITLDVHVGKRPRDPELQQLG